MRLTLVVPGLLLVVSAELAAGAVALWLLSLRLRDASIADIAWGPAFALVAWTTWLWGDGARPAVVALLVTAWAARLATHLAVRRRARRDEDPRYAAMRARRGAAFGRWSLGGVFLFQAGLVGVLSAPVLALRSSTRPLDGIDMVIVVAWAACLLLEAVADEQLRRFKRRAPAGTIFDSGVWRWSRHPNYLGELGCWWAIGLLAVHGGAAPFVLVAPALLTFLILRVSGVRLLEQHLAGRPGFDDYRARTPPLLPGWPRRSSR